MIIGSLYAANNAGKLKIQISHKYLLLGSLAMVPIGLGILTEINAYLAYGLIVLSLLAGMSFIAVFNVIAQAFMQEQTPTHLLGKVSSYVMTLTMCAIPAGQALYGLCFENFASHSAWIVLFACLMAVLLSNYAKGVLAAQKEVIA